MLGRVYIAGARGMVGSALVRALEHSGEAELLTPTRAALDLRDQVAVERFFRHERPDVVFLAAARVGGIAANDRFRWEFLAQNLAIELNVLAAANDVGTRRVVFFGSSCIYPKMATQPITEDSLLTGPLEATNEPYAIAKIAGIKLVEAANAQFGREWVSLMPTNLYGPNDNFDRESSHVLPAMIRKFHDASVAENVSRRPPPAVVLWGTGTPRREFLHVDDLASAALLVAGGSNTGMFNVGSGSDVTIAELANAVRAVAGSHGDVVWDVRRPDGTARKLLDSSRMRALGWEPSISLTAGLRSTYAWFLRNRADSRPSAGLSGVAS